MIKEITNYDRICLFCGQEEKSHYEEYEKYYQCDCKDAKETRRIQTQIEELKRKFPLHKFKIVNERVLKSIDHETRI